MAEEPLLSTEEVASVLTPEQPLAEPENHGGLTPYSLRRPIALAPGDEPQARAQMGKIAEALRSSLQRELQSEITIDVQGFQQEQAGAAIKNLPQPAWLLSFHCADGGGFIVGLDPVCALSLVELALGGAGSSSSTGREPTPLETRVLTKLCNTLSASVGKKCGVELSGATFSCSKIPQEVAASGQTVGIGLLKLNISAIERNGLLLATPNLLLDHAGPAEESTVGPLAPLIETIPVEVRPVLEAGLISLGDLTSLEPGKLLRFSIAQDNLLDLRVAGQRVFRGTIEHNDDETMFVVDSRRGRREPAQPTAAIVKKES